MKVFEATAIKHDYHTTMYIHRDHIRRFLKDVGAFKGGAAPAVAKDKEFRQIAGSLDQRVLDRKFESQRQDGETWTSVEDTLNELKDFHRALPTGHRSLKESVSVYDVMAQLPKGLTADGTKPTGLSLSEDAMASMDSGSLCPRFNGEDELLRDGKGTVRLTVVRAQGLPVMDDEFAGGSSDAYCRITVEDKKQRTRIVRQSLDPEWNATFQFHVRKLSSELRIAVYDNDTLGDDMIGYVTLLPSDFETGKTYELSGDAALPLRPEVHGMPIKGSVHVRLIVFKGDTGAKDRTWREWHDEVMLTLSSRERLHPVLKKSHDHKESCKMRWCRCVQKVFPQLWAVWQRGPTDEDAVDADTAEWVHFHTLLEACVLTVMGQETALTQEERTELMFEEARMQWERTARSIQSRRLTRIMRALLRGGHKQPDPNHPDRRSLRVLDTGRRFKVGMGLPLPSEVVKSQSVSPFMALAARKMEMSSTAAMVLMRGKLLAKSKRAKGGAAAEAAAPEPEPESESAPEAEP